jgi:hypothetical protein
VQQEKWQKKINLTTAHILESWVEKNCKEENAFSFSIHDIVNGELTGEYSSYNFATPSSHDITNLSGTVDGDTAHCQFSDSSGNEGTIDMNFMQNNEIEATITFTKRSKYEEINEGTFLFKPYNINDIEAFRVIEEHSFMVDLNSWGNVRFVPAKVLGSIHEPPVIFMLTNKEGDILFMMMPDLSYGMEVNDVACEDVNEDKLKDFIIIEEAEDYKGDMLQFAMIYLQREDGKFINDRELDNEINESGCNQDLDSVIKFLQDKFS